ncbi:hypothetical protein HPB49_015105 [Dermacentor silvarum]|uniref:Uncharacterized protein n=1 Tax=Dermacentor silvarum TaxID=543639 RepID=A0ACB8E122_DERSI|nr:hypothetical protein HPB49_015105 [Dermacentor silvarum]
MEERKKKSSTQATLSRAGARNPRGIEKTLLEPRAFEQFHHREASSSLLRIDILGSVSIPAVLDSLVTRPEGAIDDVSYVSINLAIHHVRSDNRDLVLKLRNKANERASDSCVGRRKKLFPRAECYLLMVYVKDNVCHCNTRQAPCTVQGASRQTMVVSRGTGRLLMIHSSEKTSSPGAEVAASMIRLVVENGSVAPPEYSFGVLAGYPHIHPRDRRTCMLTMQNCISPESNSGRNDVITPSSCCCRQGAREAIVRAINRVVVLYGETGSGKITEAAQFFFEDYIHGGQGSWCNIKVTQPRRMAAISMAKRAALEWHEELSDTVGFHVRLTKQLLTSRGGKLFCTAGILLRPLQQNVELQGVSHVIVDEVHERDVCTDFLLVLLREVLSIHRTFQVILMHATTNTDKFSEYFDDAPVIVILGKAHPVTRFFLDDLVSENIVTAEAFQKCASDAVRIVPDVFMHIVEMKPSEAIFCFLPGWNEINKVRAELCEGAPAMFDNWNLPLQSRLRYQEQQKIFENPPADVRKVILSTNLAETSVTVDDVVYVVGTGLHRDQCLLGTFPTSMASVQQRAGRAGRVRSGESCHLITQNVFLSWDQFKRPEIQTTDLTTVVLDCKTIVANAPHLPDDEIEAEASGRDVVRDNAGAERTVYDIMTGRQLTVSSKSNPRIDRELMAKVEKSWKCYQRARLQHPIFARREDIVSAINRVVVICGETGSGKTTQAAQFTFEDYIHGGQGSWCNIVFTQLRRIAAISLAKRVAHERHEEVRPPRVAGSTALYAWNDYNDDIMFPSSRAAPQSSSRAAAAVSLAAPCAGCSGTTVQGSAGGHTVTSAVFV